MGASLGRLVQRVLAPLVEQSGYGVDHRICLVTFNSHVHQQQLSRHDMQRNWRAFGGTKMQPALAAIGQAISQSAQIATRLLVISDGALEDQEAAVAESSRLVEVLKSGGKRVNAHAVRFFTSSEQPDTRGLASIMRLNNVDAEPQLIDISASMSDEDMVQSILDATQFTHDGRPTGILISSWRATALV